MGPLCRSEGSHASLIAQFGLAIKENGAEKVEDLEYEVFPYLRVKQRADSFGFPSLSLMRLYV